MSWRLVGVSNYAPSASTLTLTSDATLTLGRVHVSDSSKNVSRSHLELKVNNEGELVATALSINSPVLRRADGTARQFVKGEAIILTHGDEISLLTVGDYVWKIEQLSSSGSVKRSRPPDLSSVRGNDEDLPSKRARLNPHEPPSALTQVARVVLPLLGNGGALSSIDLVSLAVEELTNYEALPTLFVVDPAASLQVSNPRVRVVDEVDFGAAPCALVLEVSWRWKATSLFSRRFLGTSVQHHCKASFGPTAKPGQAYLVPPSVGADLPQNVVALILLGSFSKGDTFELPRARTLLHDLYQQIFRLVSMS